MEGCGREGVAVEGDCVLEQEQGVGYWEFLAV